MRRFRTTTARVAVAACAGALLFLVPRGVTATQQPATPVQRAHAEFARGLEHARQGDWAAAREALHAGLRFDPDNVDALNLLGRAEQELGDFEAALDAYRRAIDAAPEQAEAHYNLGVTLLRMDRSEEAIAPLERAAELLPKDVQTFAYLGLAYRRTGRPADAAEAFGRASALEPDNGPLALDRAVSLEAAGDDEALAAARRAVELLPDNPVALKLLAEQLLVAPDRDNAMQAPAVYRRALEVDPDDRELWTGLAAAYHRMGLYEEVEETLHRSLERWPDVAVDHFNLGQALQQQKRYEEAAEQYRRALELDPSHGWARYFLGETLQQLNRPDAALEEFRRAVPLLPEQHRPVVALAKLLIDRGRFTEADSYLTAALQVELPHPEIGLALGRLRLRQGRPDEAVDVLRRVREAAPELLEAQYLLGQALIQAGEVEAGRAAMARYQALERERQLEEAEQMRTGVESQATVYALRARVYLMEERPERALPPLHAALELRPDDPEIWELLARAHSALGDAEAAQEARRRAETLRRDKTGETGATGGEPGPARP